MVDKLKQNTQVSPKGVRYKALIETRNDLLISLYLKEELSKSDISFVFNLSLQLINSILNKNFKKIKNKIL
jgi:hypothetical protein